MTSVIFTLHDPTVTSRLAARPPVRMAIAIIAATLILAIAAAINSDQILAYIAYSLLAWLMVGLILCRPFSWCYSFLAVLLLLGH